MFGVIPKYTLADVIYENQTIKSIISNGPLGIDFISAGSSVVGLNNLNHKQIHFIVSAINELNSMYDFIIIDTGAGVSEQVMEFVAASNEIVLVTTPEPTSITDSYSLLKALYKRPDFDPSKVCIRVISNRAASKEDGSIVFNKINSVVMQFLNGSLEYLGYVPSDAMVEKAVRQQKILSIYDPTSKAARSFEEIAKRLLDNESAALDEKRTISHVFSNFFNQKAIVNLRGRHMEYTSLIFPGDKIDIFASGLSDNSTSYKSSFSDKLTDSMWEITMPVDSGRVVLFQLGTQFDFIIYTQNKTILKSSAIVRQRYRKENMYFLAIELINNLEKIQRRQFFRLPCTIDMDFYEVRYDDKAESELEFCKKMYKNHAINSKNMNTVKSVILDISGGGIRFSLSTPLEEGTYFMAQFSLALEECTQQFNIVCKVINCTQSLDYADRYFARSKFIFDRMTEREKIVRFVFEEERRIRRREME